MLRKSTFSIQRKISEVIPHLVFLLTVVLMLTHCGGGSGGSASTDSSTGRVVFSIAWDPEPLDPPPGQYSPLNLTDCSDVAQVLATVFDTAGTVLQTGGPWACSDGQGTIYDIPAGGDVRVAVIGTGEDGRTRYRGESEPFYLPPGVTVDAGSITAFSFVPTPIAPANGETVTSGFVTLQWESVIGAQAYLATVTDDPDYAADPDPTAWTETFSSGPSTPSVEIDTTLLSENTDYFWWVQAEDAAGYLSEPSVSRSFQVSLLTTNSPPTATIDEVLSEWGTKEEGDGLLCRGSGSDLEDGTLPDEQLSWQISNYDNLEDILFTGSGTEWIIPEWIFFEFGYENPLYQIRLTVTDSEGLPDTTSVDYDY